MKRRRAKIGDDGEFKRFCDALLKPEPAIKIFTQEALMLIHLAYGDKCLRVHQVAECSQEPQPSDELLQQKEKLAGVVHPDTEKH